MTLWLKVTSDEYELPLIVEDSVEKLAKKCGVSVNSIYSLMSRARRNLCSAPYRKVVIPDTPEEIEAKKRHRKRLGD